MNLFRSEEHIDRWVAARGEPTVAGATLTVEKLSQLAHAWWGDRLDPGWRPHTVEQNQAILDRLGLTDSFWAL